MKKYLNEHKALIREIDNFEIHAITREENQDTDALSKFALGAPPLKEVHCIERGVYSIIEQVAHLTNETNTS